MKIVVTGGSGFIGTNLVEVLLSEHHEVIVVDDLTAGGAAPSDNVVFHQLSCRELISRGDIWQGADAFVHLAGRPSVQFANDHPLEAFEANVGDTFRLLEAAAKQGISRFVLASSNAAVGEVEGAVTEQAVARPVSLYGASKLAAEAYCSAAARSWGLRATALRFANVYGPHSDRKSSVVNKFVRMAIEGGTLVVYGDGSQTRDFIYVEDVCRAILRTVESDVEEPVLQIATGVETSVADLIGYVSAQLDVVPPLRFADPRTGDVHANSGDIGLAREVLEWEPAVSIVDGIARTAEYYQQIPSRLTSR